jgi:hypothetical protein
MFSDLTGESFRRVPIAYPVWEEHPEATTVISTSTEPKTFIDLRGVALAVAVGKSNENVTKTSIEKAGGHPLILKNTLMAKPASWTPASALDPARSNLIGCSGPKRKRSAFKCQPWAEAYE